MKAQESTATGEIERSTAARQVQQGDASVAGLYVKAMRIAIRAALGFLFNVRVKGRHNLPGSQAIICCNHLGWVDPFLAMCYLPAEPRIYALGYSLEYVEDPGARAFRQRFVDSLQVMVPLRPDRPVEAMRLTCDLLKRGGSLLIFPEGTFLGGKEGKLLPMQSGAAHLSQICNVPLVPVGITGSKELWFRKRLTVRIGRPLQPAEFEGSTRERTAAMTSRLEEQMRALLPGDHQRPRVKVLRNWLTMLLYGEEHFTDASRHQAT